MSEVHAYIAGILDGEGCLTIIKHIDKRSNHHYVTYSPTVVVAMTDPSAIKFMQAMFGGSITYVKRRNNKWKAVYRYAVDGKQKVQILLDDIAPYLMVKKKQATLLLQFIDYLNSLPHPRRRKGLIRQEHEFLTTIRILNRKGEVVNAS